MGITGASGALYAVRSVAALLASGCQVELVVSDFGRRLLREELGEAAAIEVLSEYLATRYGDGVRAGAHAEAGNIVQGEKERERRKYRKRKKA